MTNRIIRYTIFESNQSGHGGDRRTAQISDFLKEMGINWYKIPVSMEKPSLSFNFFRKLVIIFKLYLQVFFIVKKRFNPKVFYRTVSMVCQFKGVFEIKRNKDLSVVLWETTRTELSFVVPLFKRKGFKIVALPNNLESLVSKQLSGLSGRISPVWLFEEIELLKRCEVVFTISREETLLLQQMGIDAYYLPYYPSERNLNFLLEIRKIRNDFKNTIPSKRKKILMLGSASNYPTRIGMENIIDFFQEVSADKFELIIAGYGTLQR